MKRRGGDSLKWRKEENRGRKKGGQKRRRKGGGGRRRKNEKERWIQRLKKGGHTYRVEIGAVHVGRSCPCVPVLPTNTVLVGSTLHT